VTKLEQLAKALHASIKWAAGEYVWEHESQGLKDHYLAQAVVAVKTLGDMGVLTAEQAEGILNARPPP
jgi:hypothetical protein